MHSMKFFQLSKEQKLNRQAAISLVNHAIFQFGNSLSVIFINLYLWRLTESLFVNGLYNLLVVFAQGATTFFIGRLTKQKGRLTFYRYGILLTALFYLWIILAQEKMIDFFWLFALLKGTAQSAYWLDYFALVFDVSTNRNRHRYLGWNQITMGCANLLGPAASGALITMYAGLNGYIIVFSFAFSMFIIALLGSLKLKKEETHHRQYYMKYLKLIIKKQPAFLNALIGWFIIGFPQGILMYLPPILLYTIFLKESTVGYLNIAFLSISILSSYVISRTADIGATKKYLLVSALGFTVSAAMLLWDISIWAVVLFMSISAVFKPLQANSYAAYYFQWVGKLPLKENFRVESVVLRETITNLGRGFGVVFFMIFSAEMNPATIPWVLIAVMGMQCFLPWLVKESREKDGIRSLNRKGG
ncbi:MFS transporter, YQGE family, putative transporter [Evansella caseinilytica]|uniref:MFS transporter, YQGE family, putative transporter n=1 Tax=Evansella caseinilytica TaxID=1503961 RepID=A0A1H3NY09_9BACI|nr:MFS transporter, YQGE family, putative transporter [Evansella caseinilytica]